MKEKTWDIIIVGGGQSGLAVAYYLRRLGLDYIILDKEQSAGGSWQHYWESLKLFSPAQWSSLPGKLLKGGVGHYPTKQELVDYLAEYEKHYELNVLRPIQVQQVRHTDGHFQLVTSSGLFQSKVLISTTGSFANPIIPNIQGLEFYNGKMLHSSEFRTASCFRGQRVGIIGEGNSGAQILAEVSLVADTFWFTKNAPDYLPDHVDGKYLFDAATLLFEAKKKGRAFIPPSLGDIVIVPSVKDARERGVLSFYPEISSFTQSGVVLSDQTELSLDSVIFCTGFHPAIDYLKGLDISFRHHKVDTHGTRSRELDGLWMVGYGSWTGFASATVIGVGRSAKSTATEVKEYLENNSNS